MISYLRFSGERFSTQSARERLVPGVDYRMDFQVMSRTELLSAKVTGILLDSQMGSLVLSQVLLTEESFWALPAQVRSRSDLVRFLVCLNGQKYTMYMNSSPFNV